MQQNHSVMPNCVSPAVASQNKMLHIFDLNLPPQKYLFDRVSESFSLFFLDQLCKSNSSCNHALSGDVTLSAVAAQLLDNHA